MRERNIRKNFYRQVIEQPYFLEQRQTHDICKTDGSWVAMCCDKILFVRAQELSSRQKAQQGSFILFPNDIEKPSYFKKTISPLDKNNNSIIENFIISKDCKEKLLKQLSMVGISKSTLFPDNIDYICEEITNNQKRQLSIPKRVPEML